MKNKNYLLKLITNKRKILFVKIIKSDSPFYWYNNHIGEYFEVYINHVCDAEYLNANKYLYRLYYILVNKGKDGTTKTIDFNDCSVDVMRFTKLEKIINKLKR